MIYSFVIFIYVLDILYPVSASLKLNQVAEWAVLDFSWDQNHKRDDYIQSKSFVPENCLLAGINVDHHGEVYVTVPRWRSGVPATLNKVNFETSTLTPYPSWDMQREGEDGDLQNVQSMTIDSYGRMWAIEVGRRNFFDSQSSAVPGAAGLWEIDLASNKVVSKYYFPDDVVSSDNSFLNDIVLDENRQIAYLTDAWEDGALIVLDLKTLQSRRYSGPSTQSDPSYSMVINRVDYGTQIFTTPTDGIAISSDGEALFYSQVQGTTLYRLPTSVLRDFSASSTAVDKEVQVLGYKEPSDGMKYHKGTLYWGALTTSTIYSMRVNATSVTTTAVDATALPIDENTMHWVDTFAIDLHNASRIWFVSNKLDEFSVLSMDFSGQSGSNMRIMRMDL